MNEFLDRISKLPPKRLALLAAELRSRLDRAERARPEPIAIVGVGCRLPGGADGPDSFWALLRDGVDAVAEIPAGRWDVEGCYSADPDAPGKMYVREGGFLDDIDKFDPQFFGIAPREVPTLDPQQRLLLEVSWEALEHAAQPIDRLFGSQTGVFIGISTNDYLHLQTRAGDLARLDHYVSTGNAPSVAAGRLSYVLGFHGPAVSVDTACSSSLVAVHLACQSLNALECRMALAGGVNVILGPEANVALCRARALAPDGRCKAFDASADGFGRSEGCGVVVLKRLSDARADGDRILAVIRGSAINQDGRSSGITAPNGVAQEALIRRALAKAGVEPAEVGYVEAHGTGTTLGDPIELLALGNVLRDGRPADRPVIVGSVKTNLGHLEAAAGVTGLIKVVLSMEHGEIPPHIHFRTPSPHIPWTDLPVVIPTAAMPWPDHDGRRIAGLSSFGFSGTNAHLVIEGSPPDERPAAAMERPRHVLTLSARTESALDVLVSRYAGFLRTAEVSFADVCHTANCGRAHLPYRLAVVGESAGEVGEKLASGHDVARGKPAGALAPPVTFLFTGQGAQYVGMARELYDTQPAFRAALDRCDAILRDLLDVPLLSVLYPVDGVGSPINETRYTQPALFAIEYALAEMWKSWGVVPSMVLGHSVGEYVAACVAGVFSLEDGLRLIATRGRLMQALPAGGGMVAVWAPESDVRQAIAPSGDRVALAGVNGPANVVVAGPDADLTALCATWTASGTRTQRLNVSHAFHSPLMEPMLDEFERTAASITYGTPRVGIISNVTGRRVVGDEMSNAAYWRRHVRSTVQFAAGVQALAAEGATVFLEVGPTATLLGLGQSCIAPEGAAWLPSLRKDRGCWATLMSSVAALYLRGVNLHWTAFDAGYSRRKVALPTYPFERSHFWLDERPAVVGATPDAGDHPLLGRRVPSPLKEIIFEQRLSLDRLPLLGDHRVFGSAVLPAAAALEIALAASSAAFGAETTEVQQLSIAEPLVLADGETRTVQAVLTPNGPSALFQLFGRSQKDDGEWRLHATAVVRPGGGRLPTPDDTFASARARCGRSQDVGSYYERMRLTGMDYGRSFRGITALTSGDGEALAAITLPADVETHPAFRLHPAIADACFQILGAALPDEAADPDAVYMLVDIDRIVVVDGTPGWSHLQIRRSGSPETLVADVRLFDAAERLVGDVRGLRLKRASRAALQAATRSDVGPLMYETCWKHVARSSRPAGELDRDSSWLLVGADGWTSPLAAALRDAGRHVRTCTGDPVEPLAGVLTMAAGEGRPFTDVVDVRAVSAPVEASVPLGDALAQTCGDLLDLAQQLVSRATASPARLWVLTRGGLAVQAEPVSLSQSPIAGLVRTLRLEHPELRAVAIDVDPSGDPDFADLAAELRSPDAEPEVAFRGGRRLAPRLRRFVAGPAAAAPVQLTISSRGIIDNLRLQPMARRAPAAGEVEIEVAASGLNFRDVLNVLGMYPGDPGALGNECVGRVVAVGDGVTNVSVGQDVMAMGGGTFASYATTIANYAVRLPAGLSTEQAATIPIAFLTAHYALNRLARLRPGERVLIHAAAGGVGLAAVQIARRAGAEVFATAGSDEKRTHLHALGVRHVFSSRSVEFADQLLAVTESAGVDVVLNSLTGPFIPETLRTLAPGGRFLEIGKAGIWTPEQVAAERNDVQYFPLQLGEVDAVLVQDMLRELGTAFEAGELRPLPCRVFPLENATDAFRFMAQARHIGKIVLVQRHLARSRQNLQVRSDATYLLTGGLGALGLRIAAALVEAGARHLVLSGRHGADGVAAEAIRDLERSGTRVVVARADVSKRADLAAVLESIQALPPLGGVVHLAGCLDDGVVSDLNPQRFARVLAPKAIGAWHLHELTAGLPLDFFVLFSSTAAVLGSPGQANYAAANAFLGALAWRRTSEGLPATNINWGPWSEAGMAASLEPGQKRRVGTAGIRELAPASGVAAFLRAIATGTPEITVIDADWNRLVESGRSDDVPSLIADLVKRPAAGSQAAAGTPMPADLVAGLAAMPPARRRGALQTHIRDQVMQVLGLAAADGFDPQQGLRDLGMDSLMAVELRNRLQRSIGRPLPSTLAFDCPTVEALTAYLANDVLKLLPAASAAIEPERRALDVRADEPIAIVGLGVRLPGDVDTPERFWHVLRNGVDTITEVPASRWNVDDYYDPDPARPGKMYTRHGGFLKEVDRFDAAFFGISRREAVSLDPQQRLLLEVSWEALERAGLAPETLVGSRSGVFVGISTNDYGQILARLGDPSRLDAYVGTGNSLSVAAGRLSYVLGLQGPCMSIDTACSSSLLAVHLAASALRNGECDMALAGGVNLTLTPDLTINFCRARMLSADGRCKTFDAKADGYVRSEGAGVVVLKRLSDALAAGNRILAVVRGSAVNQDGRSSGLTVPNGPAQQTLLREALANAGVRPDEVTYLEAHGTGTSLGDPIEMQALAAVFGADRDPGRPLVVGSIKTNMGHLEAAAGIAGLAKVVLSLQHGEIPPHLHLNTLNPHITLGDAPIVVPREPMPWPTAAERRIGGVSSFGFSGTNVHVVLESAPVEPERAADRRPAHLAVVSAKSEEGLAANSAQLADWLERNPGAGIGDVAHTLGTGRSHFAHRAAIVARSADDLESALRAIAAGSSVPGLLRGTFESDEGPHTAFLFTGQGSQYAGMGRRLYELEPIFKAALDECDAMLAPELGRSILEVMHGAGGDSSLTDTGFTQPALFALEYALARMWRSWGVHPVAVMGHSLGEYVAACVAGVFSLQDGLRLAAARGRLMQALEAPGAMAALMADEDRVSLALRPHAARVSIAAVNGPGNTVISGAAADVDALVSQMASVGVRAARLDVSHAFHSPLMDPMLEEFERVLAGVTFAEPGLAVISNVTGRVAEPGTLSSPAYWLRHVREAVRFSDGVAALHEQGCRMFVEIGPSPTLLGMARRMAGNPAAIWLPSLRKGRDDWEQVLESIAAMYIAGVRINWAAFDRAHGCRTVQLPTYAFQRQRYWADEAPTPRPKPAADVFERVETAARQQSLEGPLDLALHTYGGKWRSLERLTTAYIVKALRNLGAFCAPGDRHTVDSFMTRCGVLAVYRRLVARWMTRLASEGLLTTEADGFGVGAPLLEPDLDRLWAEATDLADVPQVKEWMRRSGAALAGVITGRESAVETLFPGGSMDMAEGLYERSAPSRYINGIARAAVHAQISAHGTPRTGRVLELGAGTGGTTSALLTALEQANVEYWFTDLSEFFLTRAKAKFSRFDFVRYALLDIEKRPSDQGYPEHAFDVVLAANVLHATTNLRRTIEHARALVAPGGVLVLCEDTTYHSYLDVTIALMEGWQRFDDDLRTDQPLLPVEAWDRALQEAGFDRVATYPGADSPAAIIGQSVIIARAPVAGEAADDDAVEQLARRIETPPVEGVADAAAAERGEALRRRLAEAVPSEQDEILVEFVRGHVAAVLRLDPSEVPERRRRLMDLGLDSLMAVELRNRFAAELGAEPTIPATLMFDYPTIDAIAAFLREGMLGPMEERAAPPAPESSEAAAALAGLSDEEVEALLIQKLESL